MQNALGFSCLAHRLRAFWDRSYACPCITDMRIKMCTYIIAHYSFGRNDLRSYSAEKAAFFRTPCPPRPFTNDCLNQRLFAFLLSFIFLRALSLAALFNLEKFFLMSLILYPQSIKLAGYCWSKIILVSYPLPKNWYSYRHMIQYLCHQRTSFLQFWS